MKGIPYPCSVLRRFHSRSHFFLPPLFSRFTQNIWKGIPVLEKAAKKENYKEYDCSLPIYNASRSSIGFLRSILVDGTKSIGRQSSSSVTRFCIGTCFFLSPVIKCVLSTTQRDFELVSLTAFNSQLVLWTSKKLWILTRSVWFFPTPHRDAYTVKGDSSIYVPSYRLGRIQSELLTGAVNTQRSDWVPFEL